MKTRRFYAGQSAHGSATSYGFANDWDVYVFTSKKTRDEWVENSSNLSTVALRKDQVTNKLKYGINGYVGPEPFTGEYWGIVSNEYDDDQPAGSIGVVECCHEYETAAFERLF